jgi:hypothetical protein
MTLAETRVHRPIARRYAAPMDLSSLLISLLAQSTPDLSIWPNAVSSANSDRWLVEHHDELRRLEPRLLVLDFVNEVAVADARKKVDELIAVLAESSRYHGYEDPKAPVFLQYKVVRFVDLTDPAPAPRTPDGSSTKYPRVKDWKEGNNFDYAALHSEEFAKHYGFADPRHEGRCLSLHELLDAGMVNEVWIVARQGDFGGPFECVEQKPVYDEHFARVGSEHRQCGNGGDDHEPWEGRSLRVNYVCYDRGLGCAMEDLGHSFECTAHAGVIPWFTRYFHEFAEFDLDKKWGLPVDSLYAVDAQGRDKASYPDPHTLVVHHAGKEFRVENYFARGGNVHFPPNARHDYDLDGPAPVTSTIEHWRCFDGPDGKDLKIEFTPARFAKYADLAPDCMGSWLVYWRQNVPGLDNRSLDDEHQPMKNWWPFLFY